MKINLSKENLQEIAKSLHEIVIDDKHPVTKRTDCLLLRDKIAGFVVSMEKTHKDKAELTHE